MIRFENVTKIFNVDGNEVRAVDDVNLTIADGEICGIIGLSGAGKSTLVRCINLLERPSSGKVYVGQDELTGLSNEELRKKRRKIGMIFQQFNLFNARTVYENIAFPLRKTKLSKQEKDKKVKELLKLVELENRAQSYPSQLSGGQKQRVAIARALASDPEVLLSDESTSALDPKTTKSILELLKRVNEELGITIVVITHEMQVIKDICDHVAVMKDGKIVDEGNVFDIFSNPQVEMTKDLVNNTTNLSKIYNLIEEKNPITSLKPGQIILKTSYMKQDVSEALVSQISRKFDLDVNIIFGNVELVGDKPMGGLVSIVQGNSQKIDEALEYLKKKDVKVEVILDGRIS